MYIYVSIYILYSKVSGQKGLTQLRGFFKDFITFWDNQKIYILYACAFNKDKKKPFYSCTRYTKELQNHGIEFTLSVFSLFFSSLTILTHRFQEKCNGILINLGVNFVSFTIVFGFPQINGNLWDMFQQVHFTIIYISSTF